MSRSPSPIVLLILDGFGHRDSTKDNAIANAHTPNWDKLCKEYPHTLISASGLEVGLPKDQMGNSEVGHLTIGAGRVCYQDLTRIDNAIAEKKLKDNPTLNRVLADAKDPLKTMHILGLLSPGGVHSHENHFFEIIQLCKEKGAANIIIHPFLDGRDTPPKSAMESLKKLEALCHKLSDTNLKIKIGSLSGRFYAMDRDKRFERTAEAYRLLTEGKSKYTVESVLVGLNNAYERSETDEFVSPTVIGSFKGIQDNDIVIFMNFRADRARQLSYALIKDNFNAFTRDKRPILSHFVTLTEYAKDLQAEVLFPPLDIKNTIGEVLQNQHLKQLRIAETEKYAHVTYFLNGGHEEPFKGEERILVPSPKIATYDLTPAMSAFEITSHLEKVILNQSFDAIICNFANADMVGHSGNFDATVKAIEALDDCIGKIVSSLKRVNGEMIITADHGNAEIMFDETTNQPHTAHTNQKVPFLYMGRHAQLTHENGVLSDIAPTFLSLLNCPIPSEMTGRNLIKLIPEK